MQMVSISLRRIIGIGLTWKVGFGMAVIPWVELYPWDFCRSLPSGLWNGVGKMAGNVYFRINERKFVLCTRRTSKREKHGMCFSPKSVNHGRMSQHVLDSSVSTMLPLCCLYGSTWAHCFPNASIWPWTNNTQFLKLWKYRYLPYAFVFFFPSFFFAPPSSCPGKNLSVTQKKQ